MKWQQLVTGFFKALWEIKIMLLIFIVCGIAIAKVAHENGKIEMCTELGRLYTFEGECKTCEETGRTLVDGECVVPDRVHTFDLNKYGPYQQQGRV